MVGDKYTCFRDLAAAEKRGEDYDFESRLIAESCVVVIAPHGGKIEPCTDKIAVTIAGEDFSFYCFKALKKNGRLHIKSHLFDEPTCMKLVAEHPHVVSIHGWKAKGKRVCVGGRDTVLIAALKKSLAANGIEIENAEGDLTGINPFNITNRGPTGRGVQFELTMDFRTNAATVNEFTSAVRAVLFSVQAATKG